ncbi:hypothetical protein B0T13DRAFT_228899 [Neurospora crassa]|nr:hypothetical protein B0T13DRAFT_228899 [Neurospora crassa]
MLPPFAARRVIFLLQCLGSARRNLQLLQIRRKRGQIASSLQIALAIRGALYWRMRRYARSAVTPCSSPPGTIRTVNREGWGPPLREGKFLPTSDVESERRMSLESVLAFWERVSVSVVWASQVGRALFHSTELAAGPLYTRLFSRVVNVTVTSRSRPNNPPA